MKCLRVQGRVAYLQKKVKTKKAKKLDILVKNSKFLDFGHVIILLKKKRIVAAPLSMQMTIRICFKERKT